MSVNLYPWFLKTSDEVLPDKRAEFYQMLQENGIIGTQAQIREIDRHY